MLNLTNIYCMLCKNNKNIMNFHSGSSSTETRIKSLPNPQKITRNVRYTILLVCFKAVEQIINRSNPPINISFLARLITQMKRPKYHSVSYECVGRLLGIYLSQHQNSKKRMLDGRLVKNCLISYSSVEITCFLSSKSRLKNMLL